MAQLCGVDGTIPSLNLSHSHKFFTFSFCRITCFYVNVCARWYWDRNGWVKAAAEAERPTAQQTKSDITKDL